MSRPDNDPSAEQGRELAPISRYFDELTKLVDIALVADRTGEGDVLFSITSVLHELTHDFVEPGQIQHNVDTNAIEAYRQQVKGLTVATPEHTRVIAIGKFLRACGESMATGKGAEYVSSRLKPKLFEQMARLGIMQRLDKPAEPTPPRPEAEVRERSGRYEVGYATEAFAKESRINEEVCLINDQLELFGVFSGLMDVPGANIVAKHAQLFVEREFKKLSPTLSPKEYRDAMQGILQRANDFVRNLKADGLLPVNVRIGGGKYRKAYQPFDNSQREGADKAGTTATVVKLWHGPHGQCQAIIGHVGHGRVYRRGVDGKLEQLTIDHLQRYLGVDQLSGDPVEPSVLIVDLPPGEELLFTSPGVNALTDVDIERILNGDDSVTKSTATLVQEARTIVSRDATAIRVREVVVGANPDKTPSPMDAVRAKLQETIEKGLEQGEKMWGNFENPFVKEMIGRLTEEERNFVITGAVRLAADMMGGVVLESKPFQHDLAKQAANAAKLHELSPAERHRWIGDESKFKYTGLDRHSKVDLEPNHKLFGGKTSFGEVFKDNKVLNEQFGPTSSYGPSLLQYASRLAHALHIAVLPVPERPYAVIHSRFPVVEASTPVDSRPNNHETLLGVSLEGPGKALELFDDEEHAYLLPLIIQLAASMRAESRAYYFDAPFGTHVFREPQADNSTLPRWPDSLQVANCLTHRKLSCDNVEKGTVAKNYTYFTKEETLSAAVTGPSYSMLATSITRGAENR